jgi:hypothetical protein
MGTTDYERCHTGGRKERRTWEETEKELREDID